MADMVIRSPRVLLPDGLRAADVFVEGASISSVRPYDPGVGPRTAPVVFPGLVDTHVHVNEPGRTLWLRLDCKF